MKVARRIADESGSATVVAIGIITAVVALALAVIAIGARAADQHRVRTAADLAAVAGATALYTGSAACTAAEETARLNAAATQACEIDGGDVTVEVSMAGARATAKAGPLEEGG